MSNRARRVIFILVLCGAAINLTRSAFAADYQEPFGQRFDPLARPLSQPTADRMTGYREVKKLVAGKVSSVFQKYLGDSCWMKEVAPVFVDSLYAVVAPFESGHLRTKGAIPALDQAANGFIVTGRRQLSAFSGERFPALPVFGNPVKDLAESQSICLDRGKIAYRMKMRKRVAPEVKFGKFSFSGGTEAYLNGSSFSRKSVAQIEYGGVGGGCRLLLRGKNVSFNVNWSPVDLSLDWQPQGVRFDLNLQLGSWL